MYLANLNFEILKKKRVIKRNLIRSKISIKENSNKIINFFL